jgi:putative ABC transport system substrate-binding protein
MRRREFITLLGGAAASWPLAARAQQPAMPVVGFVHGGAFVASRADAFRKGLNEAGFIEGQNATVEYHWLDGQYDRLPSLMTDLVRRRVAVIATPGSNPASLAAKTATTTIPIVFGVGEDPVKLGLVASLARPGGNATSINFLARRSRPSGWSCCTNWCPRRFGWPCWSIQAMLRSPRQCYARYRKLHAPWEFKRNSSTPARAARSRRPLPPSPATGPTPCSLPATGSSAAGASNLRRSRPVMRFPATYALRAYVEAGGLMSYGTEDLDRYCQAGIYTGQILKGAKPADLPVMQSTKFEFVINLVTARALGLDVPASVLARADEVIE